MDKLLAHLAYYGKAAAHTFWEAGSASFLGANIGAMLNAGSLPDISELQKVTVAAAVAGLAAVFTYLKQLKVLPKRDTA